MSHINVRKRRDEAAEEGEGRVRFEFISVCTSGRNKVTQLPAGYSKKKINNRKKKFCPFLRRARSWRSDARADG